MGPQRLLGRWWERAGTGARLWWAATVATALSTLVVFAVALLAPAGGLTGHATPAAADPAASTAAHGAGAGSMAMGSSGGPTTGSTTHPSLTVCPNVGGATTMADGMVMAPVPAGGPTAAQRSAADDLVARTTDALTKFASLSAAEAAGYVPATNPDGYVVHYADWATVASGDVLDPNHPSSLVYANTVSGPVLLGAMYMGPGPCQPGPDVGGPLTQWHAHANLCLSATHQVVGRSSATGVCTSGSHNTNTYFMLHVWTAPSLASTSQFQADLTRAEIAPIIESGQG